MAPILASLIPAGIGLLGSLFGKKKRASNETQFSQMMTPAQRQAYARMMSIAQGRMGQPTPWQQVGSDVTNMLYSTYFGRPFQQQQMPQQPPSQMNQFMQTHPRFGL